MIVRILIGIVLGIGIGAVVGYFGKCSSGTCPLTATLYRGAVYGGVLGALFALALSGPSREGVPEPGATAPAVAGDGAATEEAQQSAVLHIHSVAEFEDHVLNAALPTLADFYSDSCPPCRMLAPTIDELGEQYRGRALVAKVNLDAAPDLAQRYEIRGIPAVIFFEDGREVKRLVGLRGAKDYEQVLDRMIQHSNQEE